MLDTTAASLKPYPNLVIEVRGYTDSVGSAAYNLKLSQAGPNPSCGICRTTASPTR